MIGLWDTTDLVFSVNAAAWGRGNGTSDKNTGNMPSYPAGAWGPCVLTNMTAGYGHVYNAGESYLNYDAGNDAIIVNKKLEFTNASRMTIEAKVNFTRTSDYQVIVSSYKAGASVWVYFYVLKSIDANYDQIAFVVAPGGYGVITSTRLTNGEHTIHAEKDGATMKVSIDNVECAYAYNTAYTKGSVMCDENFMIGNDYRYVYGWYKKLSCVNIYNEVLSPARKLTNCLLPRHMGLIGTNTVDSMAYSADLLYSIGADEYGVVAGGDHTSIMRGVGRGILRGAR